MSNGLIYSFIRVVIRSLYYSRLLFIMVLAGRFVGFGVATNVCIPLRSLYIMSSALFNSIVLKDLCDSTGLESSEWSKGSST